MKFFFEHLGDEFNSHEVSKILGLNLTTIQRAVKKLHSKNIVIRHQKNMSKGGYIYTYEAVLKKEMQDILKKVIRKWFEKVESEIDKF